MKVPNKFYIFIDTIIFLLLILSFLYLFIALLIKYNLFFDIKNYFAVLIPLLGSVATVVLALLTLQMVREMKQTREEERRPYVYTDFFLESNIIFVIVRNSGKNGAKDIKVTFSPPLITSENKNISDIAMFKEGIKFLPPDKELKTWFDMGPSFYSSALQKSYNVKISYEDMVSDKKYEEEYQLDLETYKEIIYLHRKTLHDIAEELERINKTLGGFGGQGFLIETKKERDRRYREQKEYLKKMKEQGKSTESNQA
jgi:hypothetical protein